MKSADWITFSEAQRRAVIGRKALQLAIDAGRIGVRQYPGSYTRINAGDLDAFIRESTRPGARADTQRGDES